MPFKSVKNHLYALGHMVPSQFDHDEASARFEALFPLFEEDSNAQDMGLCNLFLSFVARSQLSTTRRVRGSNWHSCYTNAIALSKNQFITIDQSISPFAITSYESK
jgi:hypothetical protein